MNHNDIQADQSNIDGGDGPSDLPAAKNQAETSVKVQDSNDLIFTLPVDTRMIKTVHKCLPVILCPGGFRGSKV